MKTYKAPWGVPLVLTSSLFTVLCVGAFVATPVLLGGSTHPIVIAAQWLPFLILLGCLPFVVLGYTVTGDAILIRRLFWTTRLERAGLESAEAFPNVMLRSVRAFGNGGGFSFTGWYWNKQLRFYRAYVTDFKRTVVLRFHGRTVVLSPDTPEDFVNELADE